MDQGKGRAPLRRSAKPEPGRVDAQSLAVEALTFLGTDAGLAERFFAVSGLDPHTLRAAVAEPGFLAAILEVLTSEDALLERFAAHAGRRPIDIARTAQAIRERDSFIPP